MSVKTDMASVIFRAKSLIKCVTMWLVIRNAIPRTVATLIFRAFGSGAA